MSSSPHTPSYRHRRTFSIVGALGLWWMLGAALLPAQNVTLTPQPPSITNKNTNLVAIPGSSAGSEVSFQFTDGTILSGTIRVTVTSPQDLVPCGTNNAGLCLTQPRLHITHTFADMKELTIDFRNGCTVPYKPGTRFAVADHTCDLTFGAFLQLVGRVFSNQATLELQANITMDGTGLRQFQSATVFFNWRATGPGCTEQTCPSSITISRSRSVSGRGSRA